MDNWLYFLYAFALIMFFLSIICIWKKFREEKACFIIDLFSSAAAGITLALSATVMYNTVQINNEIKNITINQTGIAKEYKVSTGKGNPVVSGNVSFECLSQGDGDIFCKWTPGEIK